MMSYQAAILSEGQTATTDYYLIPHLENLGYEISLLNSRTRLVDSDFAAFQLIVISRYLTTQQLTLLEKTSQKSTKIVYFMDDDLFDFYALAGLPWAYQWKIVSKALKHRPRLEKFCAEFWVSTAYLAAKYAKLQPILLNPKPLANSKEHKKPISVCYHGTASHRDEINWLLPIISAVQSRSEHLHFELFGSTAVAKAVYKIPRVSVLQQMSWTNYLAYTSLQKKQIALAPLLDNPFNAARGATKFYDYARMDAVGLYSNVSPYQQLIHDGVNGFLLENHPNLWIEKILQLANDPILRNTLLSNIKSTS